MVAITNIATSARIESNSGDKTHLLGAGPADVSARCPISKLTLQASERKQNTKVMYVGVACTHILSSTIGR
jgi:hypothetical protein